MNTPTDPKVSGTCRNVFNLNYLFCRIQPSDCHLRLYLIWSIKVSNLYKYNSYNKGIYAIVWHWEEKNVSNAVLRVCVIKLKFNKKAIPFLA